jgi:hypothetical protein
MLTSVLRLAIAGWILVLLGRASRGAWAHRRLLVTIWRRIRPHHVVGSAALLIVVVAIASTLITTVPGMNLGLGMLVGTSSNAVFAPLEEAVVRAGPVTTGVHWPLLVSSTLFLLPLVVLLPWLAFVEEEVFRGGLEDATLTREIRSALAFGLVHLVMLIPLGAALAVALCGFVYGRVYRAAHARSTGMEVPPAVLRSVRPTRRAQRAADRTRTPYAMLQDAGIDDLTPERRQAAAILAASVWHTTFNSLVVLLVWAAFVLAALAPVL